MFKKSIFEQILLKDEFKEKPPVLIDIGASGLLHKEWKEIAKYSICICFDADDRDFNISVNESKLFKKLIKINRIVTADDREKINFYLAKSPHCSSILQPDIESLKNWSFNKLFQIEKVKELEAINLNRVLEELNLNYVDWYKSDSQGIDLRLFKSLSDQIKNEILTVEFEPGIIDSYKGEDKLYDVLKYFNKLDFWITNIIIKGSQRIVDHDKDNLNLLQRRGMRYFLKSAPGWCEISFLNNFSQKKSKRNYFLGWIISTLKKEHGFALKIAREGFQLFGDELFLKMKRFSRSKFFVGYLILIFYLPRFLKRIYKK
tara:strand:+ start:10634 stop:11584 length:951 start_codon:yes stop_codon:yes gene_type:complete